MGRRAKGKAGSAATQTTKAATGGGAAAPKLPYLPKEPSDRELIFGVVVVEKLMPPMSAIPKEFSMMSNGKWNRMFRDFFFHGAKNLKASPKAGIDANKAFWHIRAIMGSFEPQHEHKEAACAYLMSLWFEHISYTTGSK